VSYRPPATSRLYDAAIVGSQVGGAVAAALLARRGFRVLEVDHDGRGAGYADAGYVLPWRPALFPSPRSMPAGESSLEELGAAAQVARTLRLLDRGIQLFLPRHRLDLLPDAEPLATELRREWPAEDGALAAALRELGELFVDGGRFLSAAPPLPPRGFFGRMALRRAVARNATGGRGRIDEARPLDSLSGHPLTEALHALLPFLAPLDGPPAPLELSRVLGGALQGLHVADGGGQALRELFRRHGTPSPADHEEAAALRGVVESVELSGGRIRSVRLAGSQDEHTARVILLATGAAAFARLLPAGAKPGAVAALTRLRPARRILAVNFVVDGAAVPPPLGPAALILLGGEPVLLEAQPVRHLEAPPEGAKRGGFVFCAASAVPAEPWTRESVLAGVDRIRATLAAAIPFFDRHLLHESVPTLVGAGDGAPFPEVADPVYAPLPGSAMGVSGLPIQGPFKNLFLASRDVLPGLGLEGEIYAGIEAAAHAAAALGSKDRPGR
jgi:phytoene dehydrogenase-like protein